MFKKLSRKSDGAVLAENAFFAGTWFDRLRGMIGRKFAAAPFDAMVFERCNAIHCCWMQEAIDVLFVTPELEVIKVCHGVKPWRFARTSGKNADTIELPAGTLQQFAVKAGDHLEWK
ncbi:MAG: DUF192 domain-containing protein [Lentisphaerae bacterium]|nr:DUF192 domain-containing protein [Lentisphaerota bacterium]